MRFIRKSLLRRLVVVFMTFFFLLGIYFFVLNGSDLSGISIQTFFITLGLFVFLIFFFFWVDVLKPLKALVFSMQELLTGKPYRKVYSTRIDELGVIAHFFNEVTGSIGEVGTSIKDRARMLDELNIASQLQRDILPLKTPPVAGLDVVAKNKPASELGGDSFDVFKVEEKTYIYVGDVTGHGVAAGLIMTMVSSLMSVFADMSNSAYEMMVNVNKYIKKHVKKSMFMTMVMLCWSEKDQKLTYVGAGHEYILVYRGLTGECEAILSGGVALGMVPDNSKVISEKEIALNKGDVVVLYSDGITEARNDEGELFGLERLKNLVKEYGAQYGAEGINYHIAKSVSDYMSKHPQEDDMTLIVIKRKAGGKSVEDFREQEKSTDW